MTDRTIYDEILTYFKEDTQVKLPTGKGAQGLKIENKMFVMFFKGDLLVKLSPKRVKELVQSGEGCSYDPGTGKIMNDRILIPSENHSNWIKYCEEAKLYQINL